MALSHQVEVTNKAHAYAKEIQPKIAAVFVQFIGKPVHKVNGELTAVCKKKVDELGLPYTSSIRVLHRFNQDMVNFEATAWVTDERGVSLSHDARINIARIVDGKVTEIVTTPPVYRDDFTVEEIQKAREQYRKAQDIADEARRVDEIRIFW